MSTDAQEASDKTHARPKRTQQSRNTGTCLDLLHTSPTGDGARGGDCVCPPPGPPQHSSSTRNRVWSDKAGKSRGTHADGKENRFCSRPRPRSQRKPPRIQKKKKKLPERVTEFIQVTGHKVNPSQSTASLLGSNKQQKREMPTRKCHCLARTRPRPQDVRAERHRAEPHGPREARQLVRNVQGQERNVQTVTGTG